MTRKSRKSRTARTRFRAIRDQGRRMSMTIETVNHTAGREPRTDQHTVRQINWFRPGESHTVSIGGMQVIIRFVGRRGRRGRIAITAPCGACFSRSDITSNTTSDEDRGHSGAQRRGRSTSARRGGSLGQRDFRSGLTGTLDDARNTSPKRRAKE